MAHRRRVAGIGNAPEFLGPDPSRLQARGNSRGRRSPRYEGHAGHRSPPAPHRFRLARGSRLARTGAAAPGHVARLPHVRGAEREAARRGGLPGQARLAADDDRRDGHQAHRRGRHRRVPEAAPRPQEARRQGRRGREGRGRGRRRDRPQPRGRAGRGVDQADRRPGPHVPHPDGRDPPAHPRAGDRPGEEDRDHPQDLPLQGARVRLLPPERGRHPPAGRRRRPAVRPDDEDQHRRGPGRQGHDRPAHPDQPRLRPRDARAQPRRLGPAPRGQGQEGTGRGPPRHPPPASPQREAARGALAAHQQGDAADEEALEHQHEDGRARAADRGAEQGQGPRRRPGSLPGRAERARRPRAGKRPGPAPPGRGDPQDLQQVRGRQAQAVRRQPPPGRQHRQEVPQPRAELPGHHPGRQHGPDARSTSTSTAAASSSARTRRGGSARRSPAPSPTTPAPSASRCT